MSWAPLLRPDRMRRARRALALGLAVACVLVAAPAAGARATVSAAEYVTRLEAARALALEGRTRPSPELMDAVRARLGLPLVVVVAGGRVEVPADELLEGLRGARAADFRAAARRLAALSAAASQALGAAPADARWERELRASYRGIATGLSLSDRFRQWVALLVQRIRAFFSAQADRAPLVWDIVGWLLVAAAAALLVVITVRVLRQIGLVPDRAAGMGTPPAERVDWARAAEEALARGDVREAVRARYRLLVEVLTERGVVPDLPSLTPAECRTAVRSRSEGVPAAQALPVAVDRATQAFERVVYGLASASFDDVEALREAETAARAA